MGWWATTDHSTHPVLEYNLGKCSSKHIKITMTFKPSLKIPHKYSQQVAVISKKQTKIQGQVC